MRQSKARCVEMNHGDNLNPWNSANLNRHFVLENRKGLYILWWKSTFKSSFYRKNSLSRSFLSPRRPARCFSKNASPFVGWMNPLVLKYGIYSYSRSILWCVTSVKWLDLSRMVKDVLFLQIVNFDRTENRRILALDSTQSGGSQLLLVKSLAVRNLEQRWHGRDGG